ncbi:MAG: cyclically-permuted mutarotase family protein [Bacteroidales bacterium]
MKKIIIILAISAFTATCTTKDVKRVNQVNQLSALPIGNNDSVKGVSAFFTGFVNGKILVAGGCNFPNTPASKGGKKEYYNSIYVYDADCDNWDLVGQLPIGVGYGASVVSGGEWICLGGNNNAKSFNSVYSLNFDDSLKIDTLKSLPVTMDNFAAAISNNQIYVAGGNCNGKVQNKLYSFDLNKRNEWRELANFPGAGRVQPQLLPTEGGKVILLGGFQAGGERVASILSDTVYQYNPAINSWSVLTTLPKSTTEDKPLAMVGGFSVVMNDSILLIGGGVNRTKFIDALDINHRIALAKDDSNTLLVDSLINDKSNYLLHSVEWYQFNQDVYMYNLKDNRWCLLGTFPQTARAGAGAVIDDSALYIIGGELKPGIRTDEVNQIILPMVQD